MVIRKGLPGDVRGMKECARGAGLLRARDSRSGSCPTEVLRQA